ncbi:glycosyltransferase family 1 protein [Aeribacillus pallidus]|uniref:glycosyltransferase family 1 protein n=1 Tax=Aeribacillus pallidus TaxID=33936 RepID=UPI001022E267|nr:glycosyltransferase family 1 protein [Aeribacillus pallidus]RZI50984.1 glycosyltransferase family 1 protein [Aeribacillus pallidus]
MQKVRVLHIFARMNRGGAETLIINVFRNIDREKFQFDFLVHSEEEGHYDQEIKELGGNIYHVSHPRKNILNFKKEVEKVLRENGPYDVIHSHIFTFSGYVLNIARKEGVPIRIAQSHTTKDRYSSGILRNIYRKFMKRLILKNATDLLGCSIEACKSLFGPECFNKSNTKIIRNGIDLESFKKVEEGSFLNLRDELHLNPEIKLIGHIGRFVEVKNHSRLIKIFSLLCNEIDNVHLVLVGDGPLKNEINDLIKQYGIQDKVHMLGIRSDVPEILANLDLFLLPSLYEGIPLVLIEAQAVGLKCIASNAVSSEVDIGAELVKFVDLDLDDTIWVKAIKEELENSNRNISLKKEEIKRAGYDIKELVKDLSFLYSRVKF